MGHNNSNKVPVPRVVSLAEGPIIVPRRPHARTVKPRQWHVIKGGPANMPGGMMAAPTFNTSHQTFWLHLCEEDP